MRLRQHCEPAPLEAVDEPDLPERLSPVELLREHAPGKRSQLVFATRRRQRRQPDVITQIQVRIVDPLRATLTKRDARELLSIPRHKVKTLLHIIQKLVVVGSIAGEQHRGSDVHVSGLVLEMEERGILWRQAISRQGWLR